MRKIVMLSFSMSLQFVLAFGQGSFVLTGRVVDENSRSLPGATVVLFPIKQGSITDQSGNYRLANLDKGEYWLEISFIGYKSLTDTIRVEHDLVYNATLRAAFLGLLEVEITDNYAESRKKEEPLNLEVVNNDYLKQNLGGSLMNSLERLPGVSTIDIGSGQSKPVIRGLGFNRVVVIENGITHEAQQWSEDHGLEIDQYAVDHVEVLKGPASLIYGSDAIGGVINLKNQKLPQENTFGGTIDLTGKTNNDFAGTSVSLNGRFKWFFADARATIVNYGDYKVPTDSVDIYSYRTSLFKSHLRNTAGKEMNLHLSFGVLCNKFQSRFLISNINAKNGFFANAHGLEPRNVDIEWYDQSSRDIGYPYHTVRHFKLLNSSQYRLNRLSIEAELGLQRNFRQEWSHYVSHGYMPAVFPDTFSFNQDLERQFDKFALNGNLKLSYDLDRRTFLSFGLNNSYQENNINGRAFIIPSFHLSTVGIFAVAKYNPNEKNLFQLGVRFDNGNIHTTEYRDWFPSPVVGANDTVWMNLLRSGNIDRSFSNVTGSVGYVYNTEKWTCKANIGKSFRIPIAKELAANGVNYHHFSYEVGDPDLSPEVSYQLDAGLEYNSVRFAFGVTPFLNYFSNYIYLNPGSEHDRLYGNGNQKYYYTQSRVFRYGAEIHAHYEPIRSLQLGMMGEHVFSRQLTGEKRGFTLPFSPPTSLLLNVKYRPQKIGIIGNPYFSLDYQVTARQGNIVPPEETTAGYQVINLGIGGDLQFKNQTVSLSLKLRNLLNLKYFNHTSYYRLINVPEPGRNLVMNITIPFSGSLKQTK
jgi:iron complex outermembrane receptor protein